jgi:hypothetical protein
VLVQFVRELTEAGLLYWNGTGRWDLSNTGRQVLESGSLSVPDEERRTLSFVDNSALGCPPHFLPLRQLVPSATAGAPLDSASTRFDLNCLETCLHQPLQWKKRHHFPTDIEAFLRPRLEETAAVDWRRVILDSVLPLPLVLVRASTSGGPEMLGFAVRTQGWTLEPDPVLVLNEAGEELLPDLAMEPAAEAWRQAWQAWCQPRSLPRAEVEACRLERVGHRLLVHAPPQLIERLRTARSDAIKHEAWLLGGEGRIRWAAQLDLQPLTLHPPH